MTHPQYKHLLSFQKMASPPAEAQSNTNIVNSGKDSPADSTPANSNNNSAQPSGKSKLSIIEKHGCKSSSFQTCFFYF